MSEPAHPSDVQGASDDLAAAIQDAFPGTVIWTEADFQAWVAEVETAQAASGRRSRPAKPASSSPIAVNDNAAAPADGAKLATGEKTSGSTGDSAPDYSVSRSEEGGGPGAPRAFGFDPKAMSEEFALVWMGSKAVIVCKQPSAPIEERNKILTLGAFHAWFENKPTEVIDAAGNVKRMTWSQAWMRSRHRRQYCGIEFHPDPGNAPGTPGYLNLWSGFAVTPAATPDPLRYKTFRDHLLNNVCGGNQDYFKWVFGFFAHIVQRPRERLGTALVLRGKMGSGKTKVGEIFGQLIPRHYFLVDDPRYVTGQFNAHMATCLLLQADEAVWAGDKAAEGRLKGLITSAIQQIEAKGVDPIQLRNYVRLIMTSNEDWVVPAGKDERRFTVLDVDPRCAQNHDYFGEMDREMADGGLEALLADLLAFDLASVNLRHIPRTEALLEQKIRSLGSIEAWWFERLWSGATSRNGTHWRQEMPCATLYGDYIGTADRIGVHRKAEENAVGMKLAKLMPGLPRVKRTVELDDERSGAPVMRRTWCYLLPPLDEARERFERALQQRVNWPVDGDDAPAPDVAAGEDMSF